MRSCKPLLKKKKKKPGCASQYQQWHYPPSKGGMSLLTQNYNLGWGVAGVPEADNLNIKQVSYSTFWTVEIWLKFGFMYM